MKSLNIRTKLLFAFGLIIIASLILGFFAIFMTRTLDNNYKDLVNYTLERRQATIELKFEFSQVRINAFQMLMPTINRSVVETRLNEMMGRYATMEKLIERFNFAVSNDTTLSESEKSRLAGEMAQIWGVMLEYRNIYKEQYSALLTTIDNLTLEELLKVNVINPVARDSTVAINKGLVALFEESLEHAEKGIASNTDLGYRTTILIIIVTAMIIAVSVITAILITGAIARPLFGLQTTMAEIESSGDFTRHVEVSGSDEVGQTAVSFNRLIESLRKALSELLENAAQLDTAATDLSSTAQQAAVSSDMTSETSSAMAAAVEEMTVSVAHISQNAQETSEITQNAGKLSQQGSDVIRRTLTEMHTVAESVKKSSETIAELEQQSEKISGIVQVIKDVADQTNLLALNAAIEAARAGEQGRGFAVVADEVRKLAERTTSATGEIGTMIAAIQSSSKLAVSAMSHAARQVGSGVTLADETGEAITNIQQGTLQVETRVNEITQTLAEQNSTSQAIAQQVERVAQAAEGNSSAARGSSEAARNIEQLARSVRATIGKFRVKA
jgi:methyl-accepting chemotaxis protein